MLLIIAQVIVYVYGRYAISVYRDEDKDEKIKKIYKLIDKIFILTMIVIWVTTGMLFGLM